MNTGRELLVTGDGSHTIKIPGTSVSYHSTHGSIQESSQVFIQNGLLFEACRLASKELNVFELGFGTGLNALLTMIEAMNAGLVIHYETVEPYPLQHELIKGLNFCERLNRPHLQDLFENMHYSPWEQNIKINEQFFLFKSKKKIPEYGQQHPANVIYFDAFDPSVQPELWTAAIFEKMFLFLQSSGVLVTYSSKGAVRRALQTAGFKVDKLPGPAGKKEVTRAEKNSAGTIHQNY